MHHQASLVRCCLGTDCRAGQRTRQRRCSNDVHVPLGCWATPHACAAPFMAGRVHEPHPLPVPHTPHPLRLAVCTNSTLCHAVPDGAGSPLAPRCSAPPAQARIGAWHPARPRWWICHASAIRREYRPCKKRLAASTAARVCCSAAACSLLEMHAFLTAGKVCSDAE